MTTQKLHRVVEAERFEVHWQGVGRQTRLPFRSGQFERRPRELDRLAPWCRFHQNRQPLQMTSLQLPGWAMAK